MLRSWEVVPEERVVGIIARGTVIVHGRSDSTINRRGVRMGSAGNDLPTGAG